MRFRSSSLLDLRVRPSKLIEAKETVFTKYEKYLNSEFQNDQKWPLIYKKIQERHMLRFRELKYALYKTDILNNDEINFLIKLLKNKYNESSFLTSFFSGIVELLKPWRALQILMEMDEKKCSDLRNINLLFKSRELVKKVNSVEEFTHIYFSDLTKISDLKIFLATSSLIEKLGLSYIRQHTYDVLFEEQTDELLLFLDEKIEDQNLLTLFDRYIGNFISNHSNWSSQILDKNYPLNKLINFILRKKIPMSQYGERLKFIYEKFVLATDFIKELRALSKERADYWELKIKKFDSIDVKRFGASKLGLAMYLRQFVVVEFAPVGNALYFYRKEIFDEMVRDNSSWSHKDISGIDIGQGIYSIHKELRDLRNGNFIHSGNWTTRMDKIMMVLSNV